MQLSAPAETRARAGCLHCGTPVARIEPGTSGPFCCTGCRLVHGLLSSEHLDRYYDLRGERGIPVPENRAGRRDTKWLDAIEQRRRASSGTARIDLDVQGVQCSACVWLIETLFRRCEGSVQITVNPTLGRAQILAGSSFDLRAFVREVERFGYLFGPPLKEAETRASGLVVRMGVCIALAMNAMIFAIATYAGLHDGPTYALFTRWNLALSCASVVIGGTVFFRSAWQGLRHGILHLDLPISLGILLAFGGSLYGYAANRASGVFIDTLDVFIALMLVGRFLQERVLEKNRLALLANDGVDGLLARRLENGALETVRCTELRAGDVLVIAPGDVVPLDATLEARGEASFSLDWINGESRARSYASGAHVPAGAFLGGMQAVTMTAQSDFSASPLIDLLRTPQARDADSAMSAPWWRVVTRWYVVGVLVAAAVGFTGWLALTHDLARAIEVTTAVLIVTCPCAFGIATPLAYDLVQAGLRRAGLFVRSAGFLDRAAAVRTVVFDKTGTLTTGSLGPIRARSRPLDAEQRARPVRDGLRQLPPQERRGAARARGARANRSSTSSSTRSASSPAAGSRSYVAGDRVSLRCATVGRPGVATRGDVVFSVNGRLLADVRTEEALRPGRADRGARIARRRLDVWLLSGDESARVTQTARVAGIRDDRTVGGASAEEKAAWVAAHDRKDLLMIGDGINDSLVVAQAFCSGTPAIDRPFMAARSDFYFVTPGLGCIRLALRAAARLADVRRRNLALALAYNVLAVSLAYAGLMSPLLCAVLMPASSLTTILATTLSLRARSRIWRP